MAGVGFAFLVALVWAAVASLLGPRIGFVDRPDDPALKAHQRPAAPLGGVGVFLGVTIGMAIEGIFDPSDGGWWQTAGLDPVDDRIHLTRYVHVNPGCTIGHDAILGDYTTVAPGVHVSGWINTGERVFVGAGAVILNGTEERPLTIGDGAVIGASVCATRPVDPTVTVVGVPAEPR